MTEHRTIPLDVDGESVALQLTDSGGDGRAVLLLHGGGGTRTVAAFGERLGSGTGALRVLVPVHPGFDGTARPDALRRPAQLAALYTALLEELDLTDVLVVGNSIGGWIAAEVALLDSPRVTGVILADAVGVVVPDHAPRDFFGMTLPEVADVSYFEPDRFRIDPAALPPEAQRALAANGATLRIYAGGTMTDPTLLGRLAGVRTPVLVLWGEADRMVDPDYGRALASAIPGARFELMARTGHLPQLETPERTEAEVRRFAAETGIGRPTLGAA